MGDMAGAKTVESIRPADVDEGETLVLAEAAAPEPQPVFEDEDEPVRRRAGESHG